MSIIVSPEMYINMSRIPDKKSKEYDSFFDEELKKITYGITINGIFISGWLYWHINHWHIYKDVIDPVNFDIRRSFLNPDLRDNEWMIAEHLQQAEQERKGLLIFGSRRLGKTEFEASYVARGATLYQGSENIITGGSWDDIDLITAKVDIGLNALHPFFKFDRFGDNPRKSFNLGYKAKKGSARIEWSKILMRNFDYGTHTEAAAGLTAKTFIIDEVGKFPFLQCFNAAKPSFTSPFGWRCSPILTGTSGMFVANSDAQQVFENPEAHNFLAIEMKGESKKYGFFIPGTKRMESKYQTTLDDYLMTERGIYIPKESEIATIKFFNSDEEKGKVVCEKERKEASLSTDSKDLLKAQMYYPFNIRELFLTDDGNDFPIEALKEHLYYLESIYEPIEEWVTLQRKVDGSVEAVPLPSTSPLKPIDFPIKKDTIKTAPVLIFERPIPDAPGLYIAGADPYNQNESANSDSLGTVYIYKRTFDIVGGTFQNSIVASYAARPKSMKEWHQTVELLLDYYKAICMPENEGGTFIQYFDQKNKAYMLADGYNMLKEMTPNTSIPGSRVKGLPATKGVKSFWMSLMLDYTKEEIQVGTHEDGTPITKLGLVRIRDKYLLKEMIGFYKGGNFDRIIAFGHALAYDHFLTKWNPVVRVKKDEPTQDTERQWNTRSPFLFKNPNPFTLKGRGVFGK